MENERHFFKALHTYVLIINNENPLRMHLIKRIHVRKVQNRHYGRHQREIHRPAYEVGSVPREEGDEEREGVGCAEGRYGRYDELCGCFLGGKILVSWSVFLGNERKEERKEERRKNKLDHLPLPSFLSTHPDRKKYQQTIHFKI